MDASWAVEFLLSQKCYDKHLLSQTHNLQIGVGCSCSSKEAQVQDNHNYLCYILVARDVIAKKVVERIPENQAYLKGYETCWNKCPHLFNEDGLWTDEEECYLGSDYDIPLESTDPDDVVDSNRWCKACSELETKCSECNNKEGCIVCEQQFGDFQGHEWPATRIGEGYGVCYQMDCAVRANYEASTIYALDSARQLKCSLPYKSTCFVNPSFLRR